MSAAGLLVVVNAAAGAAEEAGEEGFEPALTVLSRRAALRVEGTASVGALDSLVRQRAPGEGIVVVGGDGSVQAVVGALRRAGMLDPANPIGIIPRGTGNDLARCLGLPFDPAEAADVVLTGSPRPLDLLVDDFGGVVVNAVHVGVGAEAAEAAGAWKERLGAAGYAIGSALAGVRASGWRLRVEVDGNVLLDGGEPALMVGLGIGTSIGGGALLTPDAVPDDGLVDVVASLATGPVARVGYGLDLRQGEHVDRPDVLTTRGRVVRVSGEEFPTNADGELAGPFTERTWTVDAGAWAVQVPRRPAPVTRGG